MSARPRPWQASDARSRSAKRRAISAAWLNASCGRSRVALDDASNGGGNQQIPAYHAVELALVEHAFSSGEPAGCGGHGAPSQEGKPEPECRSSGPFAVAAIEEALMRARGDGLAIVIPAHQVGRDRESLEVFGFERYVTIGGLQQPIRFGPRLSRE